MKSFYNASFHIVIVVSSVYLRLLLIQDCQPFEARNREIPEYGNREK